MGWFAQIIRQRLTNQAFQPCWVPKLGVLNRFHMELTSPHLVHLNPFQGDGILAYLLKQPSALGWGVGS